MAEFKPHHTIQKKLEAAKLTTALDGEHLSIIMDGVSLASGNVTNVKALVKEAIDKTETEGFDLEALRAAQEAKAADTAGSIISKRFRDKYKAIGANDSNGDVLALSLRKHLTKLTPGAKEGSKPIPSVDEKAMAHVAQQNDIEVPKNGKNPGHTRMLLGNVLRGMWNRGHAIKVFDDTIEPTEEGKAKMKAAMEKEAKKNAPKAPKQTPEEKKAADKKRRADAKAKKDAEKPPKEAEPETRAAA